MLRPVNAAWPMTGYYSRCVIPLETFRFAPWCFQLCLAWGSCQAVSRFAFPTELVTDTKNVQKSLHPPGHHQAHSEPGVLPISLATMATNRSLTRDDVWNGTRNHQNWHSQIGPACQCMSLTQDTSETFSCSATRKLTVYKH